MEMFYVYLMMQMNEIKGSLSFALFLLAVFFCLGMVLIINYPNDDGDTEDPLFQELVKWWKRVIYAFIVIFVLDMFLPNTKTVAAVAASGLVVAAAKTDAAKNISAKSVQLIEGLIDKALAETKK